MTNVAIDEADQVPANDDPSSVESGLDLANLMAQLTSKARQAIQFIKLEGLSVSEAAARSGVSESAIKVSVYRGLKALSLLATQRSRA